MLTLLGLNKVLAVYVGPSGYAAIGQFQNAIQIIGTLAGGAINTGVVKYTAEYHENEKMQHAVWQTAAMIVVVNSIILGILIFTFKGNLAKSFLNSADMAVVFGWFAIAVVFFGLNTLLLAILNGKKDIGRYVVSSISGSILSLLITVFLVVHWGLVGALIGVAVYPSFAFFVTLLVCVKSPWFRLKNLIGRVDRDVFRNLLKYTAMALTTAATIPISHILVRNHLGETLGWDAAGYWEAMWRLSGAYLMLATTTLSVYYLPRLSELKIGLEIRREIMAGYRIILPITVMCLFVVYIFRDFIIHVLFSDDFLPMKELFLWQLLGDAFKIASWLLAYIMVSKAMTTSFILTEVIFSISFFGLVVVLVEYMGLVGVALAYAINYFFYLIVMMPLISLRLKKMSMA